MKKIFLTVFSIALIAVLVNVFGTSFLNRNNIETQSTTTTAHIQLPGQDSAPAPLTMLIFGSCIAGFATLERRRHNH